MTLRSHGALGQCLDELEAFCVALGWEYRVRAVQRRLLTEPGWYSSMRAGGMSVALPRRWWLR